MPLFKPKPIKPAELPTSQRIEDLKRLYDEAGLIYEIQSGDRNEMKLLDAKNRNENSYSAYVVYTIRVKTQKKNILTNAIETDPLKITDEALIWYWQREALAFNGKRISDDRLDGCYLKPLTKPNLNMDGNTQSVQNLGTEPVFTTPFTPENLEMVIGWSKIDVHMFHLGKASVKGPDVIAGDSFTILNKEDFKYGTFDELWDMSRYNYTKMDPSLDAWRVEGIEVKKRAQAFNLMARSQAI